MQAHTLERIRRLFALALAAALFVYHIIYTWPSRAVTWLRYLGGKLHAHMDADGLQLLLAAIARDLLAVSTLVYALHNPFPSHAMTYG